MSEKPLDLNQIRNQVLESSAERDKRVEELRTQIQELQERSPTRIFDTFMALPLEDQQAEVDRVATNRGLVPGTYTIEDRKIELAHMDENFNNITGPLRLEGMQAELAKLESGS